MLLEIRFEILIDLAHPTRTPRKIGVVTSLDGAAVRDIIKVLRRRYSNAHIVIRPTRVQGEGAAMDIMRAIRSIGKVPGVDVVIIGRGGGSIEDLWAFNEEDVVRAAAESPTPLISAVGHETDTTLIDHAADMRAPTPTAAAEIAVPVRSELVAQLSELQHRAQNCLARRTERCRERLELTACRWPEPQTLFLPKSQRDDLLAFLESL